MGAGWDSAPGTASSPSGTRAISSPSTRIIASTRWTSTAGRTSGKRRPRTRQPSSMTRSLLLVAWRVKRSPQRARTRRLYSSWIQKTRPGTKPYSPLSVPPDASCSMMLETVTQGRAPVCCPTWWSWTRHRVRWGSRTWPPSRTVCGTSLSHSPSPMARTPQSRLLRYNRMTRATQAFKMPSATAPRVAPARRDPGPTPRARACSHRPALMPTLKPRGSPSSWCAQSSAAARAWAYSGRCGARGALPWRAWRRGSARCSPTRSACAARRSRPRRSHSPRASCTSKPSPPTMRCPPTRCSARMASSSCSTPTRTSWSSREPTLSSS
mmetsp:Transcript_10494/g.31087  ORF Transcript_10494/g.31087 Transcript_10494/m.31087 type:complete len:325 (+) Transcript_10494:721-1695(+)